MSALAWWGCSFLFLVGVLLSLVGVGIYNFSVKNKNALTKINDQ
jgi:hypothetical protein